MPSQQRTMHNVEEQKRLGTHGDSRKLGNSKMSNDQSPDYLLNRIDKLRSCVCRDYNEAIVRIPSSINLYDGMSQIVGIHNWQSDLHSLLRQVFLLNVFFLGKGEKPTPNKGCCPLVFL